MNRTIALTWIALLLFAAPLLAAQTQATAPRTPAEPIRITAQKMEVKTEQNVILFEGNVVVVQGEVTLTSDKLRIVTRRSGAPPAGTPAAGDRDQKIEEMVATGNVHFRQFFPQQKVERFATGQRAHYRDDEGKLVLTGEPKAWENDNLVTGKTMTFFTRENVFLVDGQVKVVFYPEQKEGIGSEPPGGEGQTPPPGEEPAKAPAPPAGGAETPRTPPSPPVEGGGR